ncbi:MAG TPA: GNAT family N-acetyltransferase [Tepidisphaeraceae bacterium]|jgi:ribosomal protein S18 acetylase RimI-like enzyme
MSLPILNVHHASNEDLIRYFYRTELHWTRNLAEETVLEFGTAFANRQIPTTYIANRMFDVALPEGMTPEQAMEEAQAHFAQAGTTCWSWVMAPTSDPERRRVMVDHLVSQGYVERSFNIMHLASMPSGKVDEVAGLTIIPARASFKHYRALAEEWAGEFRTKDFADAVMMQLDDPHVDSLLAIKDGRAAAFVAVLAAGDIGGVQELFVTKNFRGQGIGRTMMSRAMEICARSLFRHVFVGVHSDNAAAMKLYSHFGFRKIGQFVYYRSPQ